MSLRDDAMERFEQWFSQARECREIADATAMTLATVSADGQPAARTVLLKGVDERGFVFYTNTLSRKGRHLSATPRAALCFYWTALNLQVLIEGSVTPVSEAEADGYFQSRPRLSQIGAWASKQSEPLESPEALAQRVADLDQEFGDAVIPRPPHWSGYLVVPTFMEFWSAGDGRLHRRERYQAEADGTWAHCFVNP